MWPCFHEANGTPSWKFWKWRGNAPSTLFPYRRTFYTIYGKT